MPDPPDRPDDEQPLTMLGIPIRTDATLCEPGELWLEGPDGTAVRIWPPAVPEVPHG